MTQFFYFLGVTQFFCRTPRTKGEACEGRIHYCLTICFLQGIILIMNDVVKNRMGRPLAYGSPQLLADKAKEYFTEWEGQARPLTMAGLIVYLDICEDTFGEYARGAYDEYVLEGATFSETVKKIRKYIENQKLEQALLGNYNASVSIFDLKNNHGYSDKSEVKTFDMTPTVIEDDV